MADDTRAEKSGINADMQKKVRADLESRGRGYYIT